jgi:hypothetical protein
MNAALSGNMWSVALESATVKHWPEPGRIEALDIVAIRVDRSEGRMMDWDDETKGARGRAKEDGLKEGQIVSTTTWLQEG